MKYYRVSDKRTYLNEDLLFRGFCVLDRGLNHIVTKVVEQKRSVHLLGCYLAEEVLAAHPVAVFDTLLDDVRRTFVFTHIHQLIFQLTNDLPVDLLIPVFEHVLHHIVPELIHDQRFCICDDLTHQLCLLAV